MQSAIADCLYTIHEIPGKGHGLVAATTITKGTRIISEYPLFRVPRRGKPKEHMRDSIVKTVAALREEQRQAFFSLHNSFEDEDGPELGTVRTNALPLGSDATTGGIFLDSSRINHSCNPNAQNTWNQNLQKLTIHAIQDIAKGDEITIFYLPARRNRSARLHALQTDFRFTCSCSLCSLPHDQRKTSDERWDEIQRLDNSIGNGAGALSAPLQTLHDVHKLLNLLDDEGFADASVPRAYYDAFQIAITHGDIARARVFAERAASTRAILEGKDSPTVQRMESLARNPSQHMAHGLSTKWRTAGDNIPRELGKDEFERWLWRKEIAEVSQYADLRSETAFPPFDDLPGENDIDLEFYESADGFSYRPRKHWCFLTEIIDVEKFLRLRLIVKDKSDRIVPIAFYTDNRGLELDQSYAQKGFTVAILYAEQHGFLDLSVGIRHENPTAIKVKLLELRILCFLG
jgi:SET domain